MGLSKSIIFFSAYFMFNALPNSQLTRAQGLLGIKKFKRGQAFNSWVVDFGHLLASTVPALNKTHFVQSCVLYL